MSFKTRVQSVACIVWHQWLADPILFFWMNVLGFDLSVDNIVQHCLINQACGIY